MEKKSLGRGLEDITDIFISQNKDTTPSGRAQSKNPREATSESYPGHSFSAQKGSMSFSEDDIITVIDERLKVNRTCPNTGRSLGHDRSGGEDDFRTVTVENTPEDYADICEITEHVTSRKKVGYFNAPDVQQNIVKSLNQHLRRNYSIKNIELVKVDQVSRPGIKNIIEKNISIYIKEKENP